ncbi:MAG: hypothetical protein HC914_19625 [Chloroflexaceae bacterium]|nr:hypothetical protein [Chloroflexaceae bacterium]
MHPVNIGRYDAAYVQGFHDQEPHYILGTGSTAQGLVPLPPYLEGSDGFVRWTQPQSFLLFPQAGLPAEVALRLRGWRPDPTAPLPTVTIWQNGQVLVATITPTEQWATHTVALDGSIAGGLFKASDVVLELRTDPPLTLADGRPVGVLLDRVQYRTVGFPLFPYPLLLCYGALIGVLLWALLQPLPAVEDPSLIGRVLRTISQIHPLAWALLLGLLFLLLYRIQPILYPYPLRGLPVWLLLLCGGLVLLRYGPALLERRLWLVDAAAVLLVLAWAGQLWLAAQQHVTLSEPGVEADFRVFATRAFDLAEVFRADGFYNLGYPLLLWLFTPLTAGNPFLAARLLALAAGVLLLLAGYGLARTIIADDLIGRIGALLALVALAFSPLVVQYTLYIGSDMPFAALVVLALALLLIAADAPPRERQMLVALAGLAAGGAFLVRHAGLVLLVWGTLLWVGLRLSQRDRARLTLVYVLAFALTITPQLVVNVQQTGQLLYNEQAKNVWLAVYANTDWLRWNEMPDDVGLTELLLLDPPRFVGNWWRNISAFLGTGAEDTSEFGRALHLRLLSAPANWLAVAGLVGWLLVPADRLRRGALIGFAALYVALTALAFVLPRFFLPLAPLYAAAAAAFLVSRELKVARRQTIR